MHPINEIKYNNCTIKVFQDDCLENPIVEFDCEPHVQVWHRNYDFGNDSRFSSPQDFQDFCEENRDVVYLPVYLYDHSGLTVNTVGFSCPWDSGQVGYCWITVKEAREMWGIEEVVKIEDNLRACVQLLDHYLTGNVYGYVVEDSSGEKIDSCWGFFGDPKDDLLVQAKSAADYHAAECYRKIYEEIMNEHPEDLNNVTAKFYENLCDGAEDLSNLGSHLQYHCDSTIIVQIKDHFIQQHGTKARPVENDAEATKISFYGLKGIVVPASLRKILQHNDAFGSTEATMRAAVNTAGEEISVKDLTDSEQRNRRAALRLLYLAGVGDLDKLERRIHVYHWTAPDAPCGLYLGSVVIDGDVEIRIARQEFSGAMTKCLGTIIHELAHDHGGDGTLAHRSAEERMWEKVAELLVAEAGIGWLAD